jgi:hypothetical protein
MQGPRPEALLGFHFTVPQREIETTRRSRHTGSKDERTATTVRLQPDDENDLERATDGLRGADGHAADHTFLSPNRPLPQTDGIQQIVPVATGDGLNSACALHVGADYWMPGWIPG